MLGRDAELGRLHDAIEAVSSERRADRIVIVAPPGVGKSRLLAELAATTSATVLRARVRPQATAPYETVAQLLAAADTTDLAEALANAGVPDARASVIREEVARLVEPAGDTAGGGGDLAAERDARFDAWVSALDVLSRGASVWLIEDVHWAGGDLLAFLDHAGRAPSRHGRLVVATARPSLLETAPAGARAQRIDLAPLPPTEASALVRALLGSALPDQLLAAVVERSDGTPLFIEELLRTWASVGTLVLADGAWHLAVQPESVALPPTVQAIYAAQLDDLPPDARQVARRGAVAGRRVPLAAFPSLELDGRRGRDGRPAPARVRGRPVRRPDHRRGLRLPPRAAARRRLRLACPCRTRPPPRRHGALAGGDGGRPGRHRRRGRGRALRQRAREPARLAGGDLPDRADLMREAAAWYERAADAALRLAAHEAAQRLFAARSS